MYNEKAGLVSVSSQFLLCQMQATILQDQKSNRATGQDGIVLNKKLWALTNA